jgi:hypothetical protein
MRRSAARDQHRCHQPDRTAGRRDDHDYQGPEMTSTNNSTIAARVSHGLATAALAAGVALGAAATASAEREWDIGQYDQCIEDGYSMPRGSDAEWHEYQQACCVASGGDWVPAPNPGPWGTNRCVAPAPEAENVPGTPAATHDPAGSAEPTGTAVEPDDPHTPGAQQRHPRTLKGRHDDRHHHSSGP